MTELKSLEYTASAVVLGVIIAYAVALEFSSKARQQSRLLYAVPLHALMVLAGAVSGIGAAVLRVALPPVHVLADLWYPPLAARLEAGIESVRRYQALRFYHGIHAA